jgi:nucleotide-binding universal stress UspA family protein
MYRRILAAVNEHVNSEISARYALHLAAAAKAHLTLCSVHESDHSERSFESARDACHRLQHRAREYGVEADCLFEGGDPVRRIPAIVLRDGIDAVFVSTRQEDLQRRFYAGRTAARRLLHRLTCAVAVVRVVHLGRIHPTEILVPLKEHIDHIPERAEFTALLASSFGARADLFHVTRPLSRFFQGRMDLTPLEWEEEHPPDIARYVDHLNGFGISHDRQSVPGRTGRTITIEAASRRRDLIIMGASERSLLEHLLRGGPVEEVLRETPCNLIIFRPGA